MSLPNVAPCAATIGFFDGVHRGHRFLLDCLREAAAARGLHSLAVTFGEHPRCTLQPDFRPRLLTPRNERIALLEATGITACAVLDFTPAMARLTAREFMETVLRDRLGVRCLVIGYDHRFGSCRTDDFAAYVAYGRALGIEVVQAPELSPAEGHISSSVVRRLLDEGRVEAARRCLGRPYSLAGTVVAGRRMGRRLGYRTANLRPDEACQLVPAIGVYAVEAVWRGTAYRAMLGIGRRPTLDNGTDISIEVHLLDFDADLYGESLTLRFYRWLRPDEKFADLDALREQLGRDAENARSIDFFPADI